jgi:hypothetical protein
VLAASAVDAPSVFYCQEVYNKTNTNLLGLNTSFMSALNVAGAFVSPHHIEFIVKGL